MRQIHTEIIIQASAQRVWDVLTNFEAYPEWNPFITSLQGQARVGAPLKVRIERPQGMAMTFKPKVLSAVDNHELRWLGRLAVPGIMDGQHSFVIDPQSDVQVTLVQGEKFSGLLVPLMGAFGVFKKTKAGFEAMNIALKVRAESGS